MSTGNVVKLRFSRVQAPVGDARNKRRPKVVPTSYDASAVFNVISAKVLKFDCPLSALKVINTFDAVDGSKNVELEFIAGVSGSGVPVSSRAWFVVDNDAPYGCVAAHKLATVLNIVPSAPSESLVTSCDAEDPVDDAFSERLPAVADGITNRFLSAARCDISRDYGPGRRVISNRGAAKAQQSSPLRFVSKHPVSGYVLKRNAEPPLSPHWKRDHSNYQCNCLL